MIQKGEWIQFMHCLVVGGGAAGLLAATFAAAGGIDVTVIERNSRMARKVMITGKGRCNVTNFCSVQEFIANVPGNGRFLYSALSAFTPQDLMVFLEENGLSLKVERGNRIFPSSDKAVDVVDTLVKAARNSGVRFLQGRAVELIIQNGCKGVILETGERLAADAVIVATGGMSYPLTGSTGDGYKLAKQAGHSIVPPKPSLIPLESGDSYCKDMQGLSLRNCGLKVEETGTGKVVYEDFGEMLFTHFGVSGPMILSASSHLRSIKAGQYRLLIDLKPALTAKLLDIRLLRELEDNKNSDFGNMLRSLLPHKMIPVVSRLSAIPSDKKCHDITREERGRLTALLKAFPVHIAGVRPIEEAIVTAGGVNVKEIQAKTMESKLVKGLYFAGEVLDVDAYTGGFNLQSAFSTGAAAGRAVSAQYQ